MAAVCVVPDKPHVGVGVDIEGLFGCLHGLLIEDRILMQEEMESLVGCASGERARLQTKLWSIKESLLKATGLVLNRPMGREGIRLDGSLPEKAEIPDWNEAGCRVLGSGQQNNEYCSAFIINHRKPEGGKLERSDFFGGVSLQSLSCFKPMLRSCQSK